MLNFLKEKKQIIIGVIIILGLGGYYFYNTNNNYNTIEEQEILISNNENTDETTKEKAENYIIIHITGAVKKQGIVKLKENSRIEDAINSAGGLTEDANLDNVNLASILEDGMKIYIPSIYDKVDEKNITEETIQQTLENDTKVNINTATQAELETLVGIGPSLAEKIIEHRQINGNFKNIEDIKNVNGIGDNKYESIKENIKV